MNKQTIWITIGLMAILGAGVVWYNTNEEPRQNKETRTDADVQPLETAVEEQAQAEKTEGEQITTQKQQVMEILGPKTLKTELIREGSGIEAKKGDIVAVHYTGTLENGTVFDSSVKRGTPIEFKLGAGVVIEGWDKGIQGMQVGEKRRLTIPPALGYGAEGYGPIPPNATLIFEVELMKIN